MLDEWSMLTAVERLDWMLSQVDHSDHIKSRWYSYASLDIESWHVNFRSLLDQVASVISKLADRKKQVPGDSFRKLYERSRAERLCTSEGAPFAQRLGPDWLALLQNVKWFDQIVSVRDAVLHLGGHTMVFTAPKDGILFQVHGARYQNLVQSTSLMFNENVVCFERYAAHLMSYLLIFLEDFARIVYDRLGRCRNPEDTARSSGAGWDTLRSWIDSTLATVASYRA
jgi:hypothetical protein